MKDSHRELGIETVALQQPGGASAHTAKRRVMMVLRNWRGYLVSPSMLLFVILMIGTGYVFPRWADPNQNSRLNMVVAVVEDGTFRIDPYVHNTVDYAKIGDHYYSDKAPGAAFLGIPIYGMLAFLIDHSPVAGLTTWLADSAAFQATLRIDGSGVAPEKVRFALAQVLLSLLVSAVPSAVMGVLIYHVLAHLSVAPAVRFAVVLAGSLLTPAYAYANAFYGHQLSAFLLFAAFYLILNMGNPSVTRLLGIGLLLGYSVVTEYPTVLVAAILYGYAVVRLSRAGNARSIVWTTLSGGTIALLWMAYNTVLFGGPLELGYSHSELWTEQHGTGLMSLTLPHWEAVWGITFSSFRGLFFFSPWLLLALPGAVFWWRSRKLGVELVVALASVTAIVLFNSASGMWWGGFAVGPRYLLPMLPFLVLPVAVALQAWRESVWARRSVGLLMVWSVVVVWGVSLAGQAFPPDTIPNPLTAYAWPNWQMGNVARNVGTLLGLSGYWSLLPLLALLSGLMAVGQRLTSDAAAPPDQSLRTAYHPLAPPPWREVERQNPL